MYLIDKMCSDPKNPVNCSPILPSNQHNNASQARLSAAPLASLAADATSLARTCSRLCCILHNNNYGKMKYMHYSQFFDQRLDTEY